jgi:hypothetical protein
LGEPARQRSPTRNRLLLPGTAPLRAWHPTWTKFRDPVRPGRACGRVRGGSVGSGWCGSVRGVMQGRGSVGRAGARAAARSGTQRAGGGKRFARATLDPADMSARRATDTSDRWRTSRLSASHHRPPSRATCSDFRGCWLAKPRRVGLNRSQRRGRVQGSRSARDPGAPASWDTGPSRVRFWVPLDRVVIVRPQVFFDFFLFPNECLAVWCNGVGARFALVYSYH